MIRAALMLVGLAVVVALVAATAWWYTPVHGTLIAYYTPKASDERTNGPTPIPLYQKNPPPEPRLPERAMVQLAPDNATEAACETTGLPKGAPVTMRWRLGPGARLDLLIVSSP